MACEKTIETFTRNAVIVFFSENSVFKPAVWVFNIFDIGVEIIHKKYTRGCSVVIVRDSGVQWRSYLLFFFLTEDVKQLPSTILSGMSAYSRIFINQSSENAKRPIWKTFWFQRDGAVVRTGCPSKRVSRKSFPQRWISTWDNIPWPEHYLNSTLYDVFLWYYVKYKFNNHRSRDLKAWSKRFTPKLVVYPEKRLKNLCEASHFASLSNTCTITGTIRSKF